MPEPMNYHGQLGGSQNLPDYTYQQPRLEAKKFMDPEYEPDQALAFSVEAFQGQFPHAVMWTDEV